MDRQTQLAEAAVQAKMSDLDLLKLADTSLPPADAVAKLQQKYPQAFAPSVRAMSPKDYQAAKREILHKAYR